MLSTAELLQNISVYQAHYDEAQNLRELLLPSKAALLDVCGWLEEAMDSIVIDSAHRCNLSSDRLHAIQQQYVKRTYGFEYSRHFEKMLTAVIGFKVLEQAEAHIGATTLMPFMAAVSSLVPLRNHYAHTHLDASQPYPQSTSSIPAPNALVPFVTQAENALLALESALVHFSC
ncbi:hypothetical protein [Achromobacter sp. ACM05]|uniref:hypothetical protein n=1 Tax=Achromobacter sp. ACM05 TaxID=2854776 RepID=UPI001C43C438|nr:hypothetical protein [Achromobacter sp. ACM05]MBV7498807.1 hypothetical protein [Achromobacter sp. ACM05]